MERPKTTTLSVRVSGRLPDLVTATGETVQGVRSVATKLECGLRVTVVELIDCAWDALPGGVHVIGGEPAKAAGALRTTAVGGPECRATVATRDA